MTSFWTFLGTILCSAVTVSVAVNYTNYITVAAAVLTTLLAFDAILSKHRTMSNRP